MKSSDALHSPSAVPRIWKETPVSQDDRYSLSIASTACAQAARSVWMTLPAVRSGVYTNGALMTLTCELCMNRAASKDPAPINGSSSVSSSLRLWTLSFPNVIAGRRDHACRIRGPAFVGSILGAGDMKSSKSYRKLNNHIVRGYSANRTGPPTCIPTHRARCV